MRRTIILAAALLVALAVTPAWLSFAQNAQTGAGKGGQELQAVTDQQFVAMASAMDLAEISIAKLAEKYATGGEVKTYVKHLVADHSKSSKELLMIANKQRLKVASQMDAKHEVLLEKLAALKGEQFDKAFVNAMVHDHHMAIALYKSEAKNGKDAAVKAFAEKTLPVLQEHLKMAERLSGKEGGGTSKGTGTKGQ